VALERAEGVRRRGAGGGSFAGTPDLHWLRSGWVALPADPSRERSVITLRDESLVVREDALLAFEGALLFDNGSIGEGASAIASVALRGRGRLALTFEGRLRGLDASAPGGVVVPAARLVAWSAALAASVVDEPVGSPRVRLHGKGFALVALPGRDARGE
jgi:uncharacterized protein (AIM24 family)